MTAQYPPEHVILVNEQDDVLGAMEKHEAHRRGVLHRAFSIFLFDAEGRVLLQQRAADKYHSASLWTNTCCSHPRPGEDTAAAATRRLKEEMGMDARLEHRFTFTYRADVGHALTEHELDHVFFGPARGTPTPDPTEVQDWRYVEVEALSAEIAAHPERFTAWLRICWPLVCGQLQVKPPRTPHVNV
ncbi:MAG: isopentenyl-diphosphate Delta-isomerase [Flavobacteriales bacterium]|nr:isopentenyl-diphosphate Delta-isomerase [Flavobacteriales bacterium]